jgi:N-acetylglucosamine-6-phosphate deacetylase
MNMLTLSGPTLQPNGEIAPATITIDDGKITGVVATYDQHADIISDGVIAPGFIDLQFNGGYGYDLTNTPASIAPVAEQLPASGVTGFLPTCITSPFESYPGWLRVVKESAQQVRGAQVLGVHLEGVYFSPHKTGAHNPALMRPIDVDEIVDHYAASSIVRIVTLAPELEHALDAIRALVARGVIVSAGHSNATYAQAMAGIAAGIGWGTHLFNAMHDLRHREPGLPTALLLSKIPIGLIVDGVHLHPAVVQMTYRLKGTAGITLVTDAMAAMGARPGSYNLGGYEVIVDETSARWPNGTLAGSILTMDQAVRNMIEQSGCTLAEALIMAGQTPAELLGLHGKGRIAPGCDADLVVLNRDLHVQTTLVGGEIVFSSGQQ